MTQAPNQASTQAPTEAPILPADRHRPRAVRLDAADRAGSGEERWSLGAVTVTPDPDAPDADILDAAEPERRRRLPLAPLFWGAFGGLVVLSLGLWGVDLLRSLFGQADWLGWLGSVLAGVACVALAGIIVREAVSLMRLARIEHLHGRAAAAILADDRPAARVLAADLVALYATQPRLTRARAAVTAAAGAIVDGADLVRVAERELMAPLDREARRMIAESAKRVSLVTAVSPKALVDLLFVSAEVLRLVRRLSALYGGRPGALGLLGLMRHALGALAVTGGLAAGDQVLGSTLGHGLASRVSARLGEGMLNGLLTARLGLAAMTATRPMPFEALPRPGLSELAGGLIGPADSA